MQFLNLNINNESTTCRALAKITKSFGKDISFAHLWTNYVLAKMSEKPITTFGEYVRILREKTRLPLRAVAEEIGIDTSLLGKIERNERQPTKEQIKQIAIFFKIGEKLLMKELLSDQFAYRIIEEEADVDILRAAEEKVEYLKKQK